MTVASGLEVHDEQVKMICLELDVLSHGVMLLRCVQYAASRGAGETLSSAGTQSSVPTIKNVETVDEFLAAFPLTPDPPSTSIPS